MIVIFHGDDPTLSRAALSELIAKYPPYSVFTFTEDQPLSNIISMGMPEGLLSEEKLFVFELFKDRVRTEKLSFLNDEKFMSFLKEKPTTSHFAFWFEKLLPKNSSQLESISRVGGKIFTFTKPPRENLFPLLSRIFAGDKEVSFLGVKRIIKEGDEFYLLSMLGWKIRQLLGYFYGGSSLPKGFTETRLLRLYRKLFETELNAKSGKIAVNLGLLCFVDEIIDGS